MFSLGLAGPVGDGFSAVSVIVPVIVGLEAEAREMPQWLYFRRVFLAHRCLGMTIGC